MGDTFDVVGLISNISTLQVNESFILRLSLLNHTVLVLCELVHAIQSELMPASTV